MNKTTASASVGHAGAQDAGRLPARARWWSIAAAAGVALLVAGLHAQDEGDGLRRQRFDAVLELHVRDGFVDYRALKAGRGALDEYVASLAQVALDTASPRERASFWINAYNAVVLQTVVTQYPVPLRTKEYPAGSIRQIPGAFEQQTHRLAGRTVTLDQIEQTLLPSFHDPRLFFALGRGAVSSGRLRSEAYAPERLDQQLSEDAAECANRRQCVQVDAAADVMRVSSIFSWRRSEFIEGYAEKASTGFFARSPIERAVLAFIDPRMLAGERDFLTRNAFRMEYLPFDWSLNDLNARRTDQ